MKLIIYDHGDPTVGLRASQYKIDCPFHREDVELVDLTFFREKMRRLYREFATGKLDCRFDFELDMEHQVEAEENEEKEEAVKLILKTNTETRDGEKIITESEFNHIAQQIIHHLEEKKLII